MVRSVRCAAVLLALAWVGCGGGSKPASSPDEVVPLDDPKAKPGNSAVEQASSPEVADAMKALEAKQFDRAKQLLASAIEKNPKDAQAYYYLGVVHSSAGGDASEAMKNFEKAIALDSKLVDAYVNLSALKLEAKDAAGALAVADQGLTLAKKQPDLALNRALALEALGKKTEALGEVSALRECKDTRLLAVAANVARQLGASADCVATLDAALKLDQHAALYVRRGMCREDVKDTAGAAADYQKAIERDAKFPPAHYYYGLSLKGTDKTRACKEIALAAELGGEQGVGPEAKKAKTELGCK